ncbi:cbb3-type cytochrome c oxidase subunit I [Candidatus Saccharibacteria bacterium]|jgi:cytochrome o ubiquinol oxidase subunit 1|nr:cbb3-type cytochrome c oxidase subunit I [Candidatus Saccharibacteria bacterium]
MFGRLSLDAFPTDIITIGGVASGGAVVLAILAFITYKKKWRYLWNEWFTSLDPKKIGTMYAIVAAIMLLRGVADAVMIRAQQAVLSQTDLNLIDSDMFQQVFSAHGTIMIFFVAMGGMFAFINWIVPLQIGARDVAFPLLNSISFWLFAGGMVLMNLSLALGEFSGAGWLAYPPLSGLEYSPGTGVDYWIWSLQIAGVGSLLSGVNFLTTIFTMRAKGMTLMKMPVFTWSIVTSMLLVAFVFPILTVTLTLLGLDRLIGTHFFTSDLGGNPMMYINLIWAWGHPEVYILVLPAFGIFSELVPVFSRKKLFGYKSMVFALSSIMLLSFMVWLHHFFTMGAGANVNAFFGITTMLIAVPTGVKVFNWIFTMWRGKVKFTSSMIWFMGFAITFTIGGLTGVMLAVPGIDFQVHNSLFLVAHFHNMIIGGVVFGFFAGLTYWWPKFTGWKLHEGLGKIAAWLWIVGFLVAFLPLYALGFMGAVRRLDDYDPSFGWQSLFIVAGIGVMIIGLGVVTQITQIGYSWLKRKQLKVNSDPWDGRTLEWATPTPVPDYSFAKLPIVSDRDAWWEMKHAKTKVPTKYEDIEIPKNTGYGVYIGLLSTIVAFSIIWHIWWLVILSGVALVVVAISSTLREKTERVITAADIIAIEGKRQRSVL